MGQHSFRESWINSHFSAVPANLPQGTNPAQRSASRSLKLVMRGLGFRIWGFRARDYLVRKGFRGGLVHYIYTERHRGEYW